MVSSTKSVVWRVSNNLLFSVITYLKICCKKLSSSLADTQHILGPVNKKAIQRIYNKREEQADEKLITSNKISTVGTYLDHSAFVPE